MKSREPSVTLCVNQIVNAQTKQKSLRIFMALSARRQKSADNFHIFLVSDWVKNSNILEGIVDYPLEHYWRLKHLSRSQPVSVLYGAGNSKVKTKSSKKKLKLTLHKIH